MTDRALVIGAGPAGLAAALQLSTWCDRVDVVEARARNDLRRVGEHVPPAGIRALAAIGLQGLLKDPEHCESYGVRSAWDSPDFLERDYMFTPVGHGLNLQRDVFDAAFIAHVEDAGVTMQFGTRLTQVFQHKKGCTATLRTPSGPQAMQADVVVDASGRHARAIRLLGGKIKREDALVGVLGRLSGCGDTNATGQLLIEAVEDGWLYGLTFGNGNAVCVFMTDAGLIRDTVQDGAQLWHARIQSSPAFSTLVGAGTLAAPISVFDAASQSSTAPEMDRCVAVGDAAAAYDPLSSWGIVKGILDGHDGARALQSQLSGNAVGLRDHRLKQSQAYAEYLQQRAAFYSGQPRWQNAPFWQSRHQELSTFGHRKGNK